MELLVGHLQEHQPLIDLQESQSSYFVLIWRISAPLLAVLSAVTPCPRIPVEAANDQQSWEPGVALVLLLRRGPNPGRCAIPELRREGESIEE